MSESPYEYKTVALPQIVQGKRRRGMSEADLVAETLGEVIHLEAVEGWEYLRSDILAAGTRGGLFSREPRITHYTVLIFRRAQEGAWPVEHVGMPYTPAPTKEEAASPEPKPAPPPEPKPAPAPPAMPMISDPTSPLARGDVLTTGGPVHAEEWRGEAGRAGPRPPLGSAQD